MLNRKRAAAWALCAVLLLNLCPQARAGEEAQAVFLSTAGDWTALVRSCALDSWSRGRTVYLQADLDLSGVEFAPIPTFGGVFEGQGHSISGISLSTAGSSMGLFRFLQEGAVVRELNVSGTVRPGGSAAQVGGIAGVNGGCIQNCTFRGTVQGERCVGGIAGLNRETGQISGCTAFGQIAGFSATGGITGQNSGVLLKCTSQASVNTASPDVTLSLQDLAADASAGALAAEQEDAEQDMLRSSHSNTGGVAGLSTGVVLSCTNTGAVGYPHVGYNVGGIAGRQSGYLSGCVNSGVIQGRKDVGGIVGQMEPDVLIRPGADTLEELRRELNGLDGLINRTLTSADGRAEQISRRLSAMGAYAGDAKEHSHTLLDETNGFVDGNVEQLNGLSVSVTAALDRLSPALDELAGASGRVEDLCGDLNGALDALTQAGQVGQDAAEEMRAALNELARAGRRLEQAQQALAEAVDLLQNAVLRRDEQAQRQALKDLSAALSSMAGAFSSAGEATARLLEALQAGLPFPDEEIQRLTGALSELFTAAGQAAESVQALSESVRIDFDALREALGDVEDAFLNLSAAARRLTLAASSLRDAAEEAAGLSDPLSRAADCLRGAADTTAEIGAQLESAFTGMRQAVDGLREGGPVSLLPLGEEFRAAGDGLYAAVNGLSEEMSALHQELSGGQEDLSGDLRAISRQLNVISTLLLDAMSDIQQGVEHPELVVDSSDQDIDAVRQGKVAQCRNTGAVEGDRNVGGVAGSMSVEYGLDPEEDVERFSLGSVYETRAVLLENVNQGGVAAKKDCAGGLVGRMDLGAAVRCENYGDVESAGGSYVGGVAGWSESVIRQSCAKCVLTGDDYVGGIAGWAVRMEDCRAIAVFSGGGERIGAIAGDADLESGQIKGNCFVDTGWAGIDAVSYEGVAQPVAYSALCAQPDVPQALLTLTLTLRAGEETVAVLPLTYGQTLGTLVLPQPPEREGCYGRWPDVSELTAGADVVLEAVYTPWAALTASAETAEGGVSLALAEGQFTQDAQLHVRPSAQAAPQQAEGAAVWEVCLAGTGLPAEAQVPLRLLDQTGGGGQLWQYRDGRWREVEAQVNGQYLLLTMDGLSAVYCIVPGTRAAPAALVAAGAALLAAGVLLARAKRRRKRSKAGAAGSAR